MAEPEEGPAQDVKLYKRSRVCCSIVPKITYRHIQKYNFVYVGGWNIDKKPVNSFLND